MVMHEYAALALAELTKECHAATKLLKVENSIDILFLRITSPDPDVEKNCLDVTKFFCKLPNLWNFWVFETQCPEIRVPKTYFPAIRVPKTQFPGIRVSHTPNFPSFEFSSTPKCLRLSFQNFNLPRFDFPNLIFQNSNFPGFGIRDYQDSSFPILKISRD